MGKRLVYIICVLWLTQASPLIAKTYKCADAEGIISYSQFPCPEGQQRTESDSSSGFIERSEAICSAVTAYAHDLAERMRNGGSASDEIASYGGINAIPVGALNIINYVYGFRAAQTTSSQRIAVLSSAKCGNEAFGKLSYADLPEMYNPEKEERETAPAQHLKVVPVSQPVESKQQVVIVGGDNNRETNQEVAQKSCQSAKRHLADLEDKAHKTTPYSAVNSENIREQRREYRKRVRDYCGE